MDRRERIAGLTQDKEEAMLLAMVLERITAAQQREIPAWTPFLSQREQMLCKALLPEGGWQFFGGSQQAERAMCVYVPEYLEPDWLWSEDSPIAAVRAVFFGEDRLTHRDFLGSLMGCGIRRETVGDIFVREGGCDFLVTREILPYVLQNLTSAGRTALHLQPLPLSELQAAAPAMKTVRDTVSSLRLDALVSSGFGLSRAKAALYIESGKTELNYALCTKPDRAVSQGDTVSVRGLGKLRLTEVGNQTKKGRIAITVGRLI